MKKKKILKRLKYIDNSNYKNPVNPFEAIKQLIYDIEKDMKPEREYLTPLAVVAKLYNGEAKKVTHNGVTKYSEYDGGYVTVHYGALAWFDRNGNFLTYRVDLIDEFKWWVVE